jgi:hypothetical protein
MQNLEIKASFRGCSKSSGLAALPLKGLTMTDMLLDTQLYYLKEAMESHKLLSRTNTQQQLGQLLLVKGGGGFRLIAKVANVARAHPVVRGTAARALHGGNQ